MENLGYIADICSILSFFGIGILCYQISQSNKQSGSNNKSTNQTIKGNGNQQRTS